MANTGKVLVIVTNAGEFEKSGFRTGLWLSELVDFQDVVEAAGYQVDIASPKGGQVPIDPMSMVIPQATEMIGLKTSVTRRYMDRSYMDLLDASTPLSEADASAYDAIYLAGGHGAMFDFPGDTALARLIADFYQAGKVVSAVCHGPCGLLDVTLDDGQHLLEGKNVTGFSWNDEVVAKRSGAVPFNLEQELRQRGAHYSKAFIPLGSHVVEDGLLITGQNPASVKGVGQAVVRKLAGESSIATSPSDTPSE